MNEVTTIHAMSSREIAVLCGKAHKHVLADIDKMFAELNLQSAEFLADYRDARNRRQKCFQLPKRECLILVSGYSIKMRAAIIDRWELLERAACQSVPGNIEDIARIVAEATARAISNNLAEILTRIEQIKPPTRKIVSGQMQGNSKPSLPGLERMNIKHRVSRLAQGTIFSEAEIYSCIYDNMLLDWGFSEHRAEFRAVRKAKKESSLVWLERRDLLHLVYVNLEYLEGKYGR